jgi:hypothetical protein
MSTRDLIDVLNQTERSLNELGEFVAVYTRAAQLGRDLPKVSGQISNLIRELGKQRQRHKSNFKLPSTDTLTRTVRALQKLVAEDVEAKIAYLHGIGLVQCWTALEATMNDFCLEAMNHGDAWKDAPSAQSIRVKIADILTLDKTVLMRQLLDAMLTELGARRSNGVDRFELILAELGFGGAVDARVSRQLLWLAEARNVLIHRQGRVDIKFTKVVGWTKLKPGDLLSPTARDFKRSRIAVRAYTTIIKLRLVKMKLAENNESYPGFLAESLASLKDYENGGATD